LPGSCRRLTGCWARLLCEQPHNMGRVTPRHRVCSGSAIRRGPREADSSRLGG
jgi:hypothetical protein